MKLKKHLKKLFFLLILFSTKIQCELSTYVYLIKKSPDKKIEEKILFPVKVFKDKFNIYDLCDDTINSSEYYIALNNLIDKLWFIDMKGETTTVRFKLIDNSFNSCKDVFLRLKTILNLLEIYKNSVEQVMKKIKDNEIPKSLFTKNLHLIFAKNLGVSEKDLKKDTY